MRLAYRPKGGHPLLTNDQSTLRGILCTLPDQALLDGLQAARGNGRNDYPVEVLWGCLP